MDIESEVRSIQERNKRVEQDKAWEVSWTRRIFIAVVSYLAAGFWLASINDSKPWLKALIPAVAYIFSTLTLPSLKKFRARNK